MTTKPDETLQSPQDSDAESVATSTTTLPRRLKRSPLSSVSALPSHRSNASLSSLFASTTSLPTNPGTNSGSESGTATPTAGPVNGSIFSPGGSTVAESVRRSGRSPSPAIPAAAAPGADHSARDLIVRAFAPHVSVLASQDSEELVRHKGINGGLLELLRPFGERVQGKVTIRDSSGVSRSWDDYGIRFVGVKDGLESPRLESRDRASMDSSRGQGGVGGAGGAGVLEYKPARLRTGGDVAQIEELVQRHLTFAEEQSGPVEADYLNHKDASQRSTDAETETASPFYHLYLRRLLSGLPLIPSETFSHPVATCIAISSRSASPIEELRNLFAASNQGEHRLPLWVHNEFLRYYILIHDEDYDDLAKSMQLFDQMKRHFGLHCHLLRLRSTPCQPSPDSSEEDAAVKLSNPTWLSAGEELSEIIRLETADDTDSSITQSYIFPSDAEALKAFVREMVTQSLIPSMERASSVWNDQVASRRRGLSGRFMSLSKRFTPTFGFGGSNNNNNSSGTGNGGRVSSMPSLSGGNSSGGSTGNYDSGAGFYRPDAPEAVMRKLADYGVMLRDYKLAQGVYEILCGDFKGDKAWRHYAGANEMSALTTLLGTGGMSAKTRGESVDQFLETAYYSYITRVGAPFYALRTLVLGAELLKIRGGSSGDDAARWFTRGLDDRLVGSVGRVLVMERLGACFSLTASPTSPLQDRAQIGSSGAVGGGRRRRRKAAFWNLLACDAWLAMDLTLQAERSLVSATGHYLLDDGEVRFEGMAHFLSTLQAAVKENRHGLRHLETSDLLNQNGDAETEDQRTLVETLQSEPDHLGPRSPGLGHRKSLSTAVPPNLQTGPTAFDDPLGAVPSAYQGEAVGSSYPEGMAPPPKPPMSPGHVEVVGSTPLVAGKGRTDGDDGFE